MLNNKKLQAWLDKVTGVTTKHGDLNSTVYLQQIRDAIRGTTPAETRGNLAEHIYLQQIRNAIRGVADGQFGSMPASVYLQQIINAYNGVADGQFGSLSTNTYLDVLVSVATGAGTTKYTISGTVYDANGSTAVAGATVALGALSATSAANGTFTISDVPAGTSGNMTCTKAGYSWTAKTIAAMSGNIASQNYTNAWWAGGGCAASCVAAYNPVRATSLANSYINLAHPGTNDAALGAAPDWWTGDGWWFDGVNYYLKSGIQPNNGWSQFLDYADDL